jgi:hypothetical protein
MSQAVTGTTYSVAQADAAVTAAQNNVSLKDAALAAAVDQLNRAGLKDEMGNPLIFSTAQEWADAWANNRGWKTASGLSGTAASSTLSMYRDQFTRALSEDITAKAGLTGAQINQDKAHLQAMLDSHDIEGALNLILGKYAAVMDVQLKGRLTQMQSRNARLKDLNAQLAAAQAEPAGEAKDKKIATINGDLQGANSDAQQETIYLNQDLTKRNQAFDLESNVQTKFRETLDHIIGNFR